MGQSKKLSILLRLIDEGSCVAAYVVSDKLKVQFPERTLKKWRRQDGPRATYAWLMLEYSGFYGDDDY